MTESGDEEETEGIVNQVLDEIGIEVSGKVRFFWTYFKFRGSFPAKRLFRILKFLDKFSCGLSKIFCLFNKVFHCFQMADAPSVARNKVGDSTSDADKELMAQLNKLRS